MQHTLISLSRTDVRKEVHNFTMFATANGTSLDTLKVRKSQGVAWASVLPPCMEGGDLPIALVALCSYEDKRWGNCFIMRYAFFKSLLICRRLMRQGRVAVTYPA
jgi:hypothetical protein